MIKYKLKHNGQVRYEGGSEESVDLHFTGKIKAGWRTAQQLLELGLLQEGREQRVVVDREAYEVVLGEEYVKPENFEILEREVPVNETESKIEKYYIVPEQNHIEYKVEKNYSIEIEDTSAQELAETTAKAERKADLAEIKGFLKDINDSDLKPWHKKILKFLVKEQKE
jgi:hypothetical protein